MAEASGTTKVRVGLTASQTSTSPLRKARKSACAAITLAGPVATPGPEGCPTSCLARATAGDAEGAASEAYDLEFEHAVCAAGVARTEDGFETAIENGDD